MNKPLDKRGYKGTFPTCHDFNLPTRSVDFLELIIGFSAGQIQLIDPIGHELNKLYNEEVSRFSLFGDVYKSIIASAKLELYITVLFRTP